MVGQARLLVGIDMVPAVIEATRQSALPDMSDLNADNGLDRVRKDEAATAGQSVDDQTMPQLAGFQGHLPNRSQNTFDRLTVQDVIRICPQIEYYAPREIKIRPQIADHKPISTWQDLIATAKFVAPMLGISPDLWGLAARSLGEEQAAATVAYLLENTESIDSPSDYLGKLVKQADAGKLDIMRILASQERKQRAKAIGDSRSS